MSTSDADKAIASRNATTHGLSARDVVLPSFGEDAKGDRRLEAEWMGQFPPPTRLTALCRKDRRPVRAAPASSGSGTGRYPLRRSF